MARKYGVARRLAVTLLAACLPALAAGKAATPTQSDSSSQDEGSSSSSRHKPGTNSGQKAHHTTVAEEDAPPPELAKAEALIQKQDYAGAEPLLRKLLGGDAGNDPANYVAWFELGFVE